MEKEQKKVLFKGTALHLAAYALVIIIMAIANVPHQLIFAIGGVLILGLAVLSYAYVHRLK